MYPPRRRVNGAFEICFHPNTVCYWDLYLKKLFRILIWIALHLHINNKPGANSLGDRRRLVIDQVYEPALAIRGGSAVALPMGADRIFFLRWQHSSFQDLPHLEWFRL